EAIAKGRAAAERAIALDPRMGDPHASLGRLRSLAWEWRGAETEFLQALRYNASCVTARNWYSSYLSCTGDYSLAIEQAKAAIALDPLNARSFEGRGARFYTAPRYSGAIADCSPDVQPHLTN